MIENAESEWYQALPTLRLLVKKACEEALV